MSKVSTTDLAILRARAMLGGFCIAHVTTSAKVDRCKYCGIRLDWKWRKAYGYRQVGGFEGYGAADEKVSVGGRWVRCDGRPMRNV